MTDFTLEDAAILLRRISGKSVRPYSTRDFGREKYPSAISIIVSPQQAETILGELREKLPAGFIAFIGTTNSLAQKKPRGVEMVVANGMTHFEMVRVAASDGANYGLDTEAIIRELETWDREFGIDIWHAETDTIQMRFLSLPPDLDAFAARVYKFCPDIVDQGVGDLHSLRTEIVAQHGILLWWD